MKVYINKGYACNVRAWMGILYVSRTVCYVQVFVLRVSLFVQILHHVYDGIDYKHYTCIILWAKSCEECSLNLSFHDE